MPLQKQRQDGGGDPGAGTAAVDRGINNRQDSMLGRDRVCNLRRAMSLRMQALGKQIRGEAR